jgi:CubicO group peptidase (beta-lactamase class C family)
VKKILFLILAIGLLQNGLVGQSIETSTQPHPAVDNARLSNIDALVNEYISKNWLKGAVALVIKDNKIVLHKGYGYADAENRKPMQKDAIFRIMSQSKAITSAGILILYERGKLRLDQPISDFIPEFKNPTVLETFNPKDSSYTTVQAKREITFRDLLTHTSGIGYAAIGDDVRNSIYAKANIPSGLGYFNDNLLERMKALGKLPLAFNPGEKYMYGLNTDLLGCLIEVISGVSLEEFLTKNIFEPLGMKDTYFNVPSSKANRLPVVYTEETNHSIIPWSPTFRNINPDYPLMNMKYFSGGAGLSSTALDYAIFLQMVLNGGKYNGKQILSRRTCEIMTSPQLDFAYNGVDNMGLGFGITSEKSANRNSRNKDSFSWGGYYGTTYWADRKEKMICLFMTQQNPNSHGEITSKFEVMVYSALK